MKQVGIIMGSKSDLPIMQKAIDILKDFGVNSAAPKTTSVAFQTAIQYGSCLSPSRE